MGNLRFTFETGTLEGWKITEGQFGKPFRATVAAPTVGAARTRELSGMGAFVAGRALLSGGAFPAPSILVHVDALQDDFVSQVTVVTDDVIGRRIDMPWLTRAWREMRKATFPDA